MRAKLIDAGIDYVRLTSQEDHCKSRMFEYFRKIALVDEAAGGKIEKGGIFGFYGQKSRHALFGDRKDWSLVQASGRFAKDALVLARPGIQASRIDVQVTMRVEDGSVSEAVREAYNNACDVPCGKHRPRDVKMTESRRKAQTVYIGSRFSDIYVRIYDKEAESGQEEYKNCIRFEVEIKGRASKQLWQHMTESSDGVGFLVHLLVDVLKKRGIEIDVGAFEKLPVFKPSLQQTKAEATMAWFNRVVAPSVAKMCAEQGWINPFRALFDRALSPAVFRDIMGVLVLSWDS